MHSKMFFYSLVCIFLFQVSGISQDTDGEPNGGAFLELGIGGRAMGMGEAYVSVANDGSAFYWNPAGAATLLRSEVSGMYASLFKGLVKHFHVGITRPLVGSSVISLNWIRLSVPDIPQYNSALFDDPTSSYDSRVGNAADDPNALWSQFGLNPLGLESSNDDAFFITLAKQNKFNIDFGWQYFVIPVTIPVGINVKLLKQNLFDKQGSALGFDFGTMFKIGIDDLMNDYRLGKLRFGLVIKDLLNTKINWNTDARHSAKIPRSWHIGGSYLQPLTSIGGQLLVSYDYSQGPGSPHKIGLEYVYYEQLAVRFGLSDERFTAGIGLKISPFQLDYAFRSHELGGSHRINTAIRF